LHSSTPPQLDEAHNIKERSTNTAKAAFQLKSDFKWCLSGTPLQNRVGELYSLIRFLGGDPFSFYFCEAYSQFQLTLLTVFGQVNYVIASRFTGRSRTNVHVMVGPETCRHLA
jgi:hypothetical protein